MADEVSSVGKLHPDIIAALDTARQALASDSPDVVATVERQMEVLGLLLTDRRMSVLVRDVARLAMIVRLPAEKAVMAERRAKAIDALDWLRLRLERQLLPIQFGMWTVLEDAFKRPKRGKPGELV